MNVSSATPTSSMPMASTARRLRRGAILTLMGVVLLACAILSLCLGRYAIAPADVVQGRPPWA